VLVLQALDKRRDRRSGSGTYAHGGRYPRRFGLPAPHGGHRGCNSLIDNEIMFHRASRAARPRKQPS
jgi:hypothetical protein